MWFILHAALGIHGHVISQTEDGSELICGQAFAGNANSAVTTLKQANAAHGSERLLSG